MVDTLITDRLTLRRFAARDTAAIVSAMETPEIARMIPRLPWPYTAQDATHFIDQIAAQEAFTFAVTHDDALIGAVSAQGQLGYWLIPAAWGKGFASEASRAVLDLRFAQNDHDVMSGHRFGNARSRSVLLKLGFKDTETRKIFSNYEGNEVVLQDMTLSADNWRNRA